MTGTGAKAIFKAEVIVPKEELYDHLSKVEKQSEDHVDIVSSVEKAKIVTIAKVENVVHCMDTLRKELVEAKA